MVVTVNVALVSPALIVTLDGTLAAVIGSAASDTSISCVVALERVTRPSIELPPAALGAVRLMEFRVSAV
jgi:hypothetical protein